MNWNRVVIASTAFALLGVVTLALSRTPAAKAQIRAPSAGAVHKAFTATLVENRYDASGALKSVEVSLVAAKSDGSSVWVRQSLNGRPMALRRVRDLSAGKSVTIDPVTESTTTYLMSSDELTALRAVPACGRPAPGQLDAILGQGVVHQLQQLPDGSQLQESVAPDLDCFPMRLV